MQRVKTVEMSDILGKLKSGAGRVAKEADRVAHVKRIELEISSIERQVEDQYQKLGEMFYNSSVAKEAENPEAVNIISKINELKEKIKDKRGEISKINQGEIVSQAPQQTATPQTPSPVQPLSKKQCPSCGKESDENTRFCPECGAKLD